MPALPTVGASSGTWGTDLNTWLKSDHNDDATHKEPVFWENDVVSYENQMVTIED